MNRSSFGFEADGSGALEFDGLGDWVETAFAGLGGDMDRTAAAWVKLAPDFGVSNGQAIVGWEEVMQAYIQYADGSEELYDHETDPREYVNLAGKTQYESIVKRMSESVPSSWASVKPVRTKYIRSKDNQGARN